MNKKSQAKVVPIIIICFFLVGVFGIYFVLADDPQDQPTITYTSSTDTICKDGTCNLIIYSGIRNVYEDGNWKRIENARSLKDKGFNVVYLENDSVHLIGVVDFNYSSITLNFSYDENYPNISEYEYEIEEGKMKTKFKIIRINETNGEEYEEEIEIEIEEGDKSEFTLNEVPLGKKFQLGGNSTTITLQDNETENLGDITILEGQPDTSYPDSTAISVGEHITDDINQCYIKFNITAIPDSMIINNATLSLFMFANLYDSGETASIRVYEVDNQTWIEDNITWNNPVLPVGALINSSNVDGDDDDIWVFFNVTSWVLSEYNDNSKNISFNTPIKTSLIFF